MRGNGEMRPLRRRPDWVRRLTVAIEIRADRRFAWGRFDCCLAACDLVKAMTGEDPAKELRGYKDARGAMAGLASAVGRKVPKAQRLEAAVEAIARAYGAQEVPVAYAQRGDVVVVEGETPAGRSDVMAVVDLSGRFVVAPGGKGWRSVPLAEARRAWHVGG